MFSLKCVQMSVAFYHVQKLMNHAAAYNQVIPGNDQNTSPTNQKTAGSKLERTS